MKMDRLLDGSDVAFTKISCTKTEIPTLAVGWYNRYSTHYITFTEISFTKEIKLFKLGTFINCIINEHRILLVTERTRQSKIDSRKQTPRVIDN